MSQIWAINKEKGEIPLKISVIITHSHTESNINVFLMTTRTKLYDARIKLRVLVVNYYEFN